ncbi:hypothetical protein HCC36_16130 [Listeria booriae]|uniref:Uncharacterized protein n=1 Tax=Listeria booriae TaxID=1552123 RepID=A0A842GC17_9LIST|nr:hypothetical protein [Listeria booriae]MBC2294752.1 hypothetical protein [Listeria booriae]
MTLDYTQCRHFVTDFNFLAIQKQKEKELIDEIHRLARGEDVCSNVRYGDDSILYILPAEESTRGQEFTFVFYLTEKVLLYSGWSAR